MSRLAVPAALVAAGLVVWVQAAFCQQPSWKVIRIVASDRVALVRTGKGRLEVVGVGDRFDTLGTVVRVERNRIVVRPEDGSQGAYWLVVLEKGKQKLVKVGGLPAESEVHQVPSYSP